MKGNKYVTTYIDGDIEFTNKLNYVELPLLFKFYPPVGLTAVKLNLFAGPQISYNVSTRYKEVITLTGIGSTEEEGDLEDYFLDEYGISPDIKKLDYGAVFGVGVDFIVAGTQMTVDARYDLSFAELLEVVGMDFQIKNGVFSILVGVGF